MLMTTPKYKLYRYGMAALVIGRGITLAGCDPLPPSADWSIRVDEAGLWFATCDPATGGSITGYVEQPTGPRWAEFWEAHGDVNLSAGDVIVAGENSHGIDRQEFDPLPLADAEVVVVYLNSNGTEVANASFQIPAGYSGEGWLRVDSSITPEPCSADPSTGSEQNR